MKTFADWLRYYNDLDVAPGLEALEKMRSSYIEKGIDIFERRRFNPRRFNALSAARGNRAGRGSLGPKQGNIGHTERSCCWWAKHCVHAPPRSGKNENPGPQI